MSYPRTIQALVIEDNPVSKEYYEEIFDTLQEKHAIAPPHWAFCHDDGKQRLEESRIYHLVTIDLRLPESPGQPAVESLDYGQALIRYCANRNAYPIPAVLVITAHLDQTSQQELSEFVSRSFAYGRVLVKSEHMEEEIEKAVCFIERYCDVGIHIRDGGSKLFPTLTPREEDLLRQIIVSDDSRDGVDLAWWSTCYSQVGGWTKTLIGRFLLSEGRGHSLYSFFKLTTDCEAAKLFGEVEVMSQKLRHVKVMATRVAGDRSLLVTQSVGSGNVLPLSLNDVLSRPTSVIKDHLERLAFDIVGQVAAIGDRTPDQRDRRCLLWRHHDRNRIETQWEKRGGHLVRRDYDAFTASPVELFDELTADRNLVRYDVQTALHGDLNFTNVAIESEHDTLRAYIFDASGCEPGVCIRDVAMLEVATLLHQEWEEDIVPVCHGLYSGSDECGLTGDMSDRQKNTLNFIRQLRAAALRYTTEGVYGLMVFDHALIQLGGLDFGSSQNKIASPRDACILSAFVAKWFRDHHQSTA